MTVCMETAKVLEKQAIVLDIGAFNVKLGFSDVRKSKPDYILKTSHLTDITLDQRLPAPEYEKCCGTYNCSFDEISAESLVHFVEKHLHANPEEHPVLLTESFLTERKCRNHKLQVIFEELGASAFALSNEALLSLYSTGRTTGVVVESGYSKSYCCAIHEGISPPYTYATMHCNSGRSTAKITENLMEVESCKYTSQCAGDDKSVLQDAMSFMENNGKISVDPSLSSSSDIGYEIGEALFGKFKAQNSKAIHTAVEEAIYNADEMEDYNHFYYENIVLSGGNTLYPGLKERLELELEKTKVDKDAKVSVIAAANRQFSSWIGGSIVASLPTFKHRWITKEDYRESGNNIFYSKCLPY